MAEKLMVVIPCYNEEEVLPETSRRLVIKMGSLMEKGLLREVGFVRSGKTYARTFEPAMSQAEYLAQVINERLPAAELPELLSFLMQKYETTPQIQKEMRAALRENAQ